MNDVSYVRTVHHHKIYIKKLFNVWIKGINYKIKGYK